jgi:dihydroflavonol-4-reductase
VIKEAAVVVGTGHLGVHLADQLVKEGREVRVLAYNCAPVPKVIGEMVKRREVKVCMGDILKPETLMEAFRNAGVVYLAAAYICLLRDWERMEAVNVRGVENVTRVARCEGVPKVIYFSSIHAMKQEPIDQKLDEKRELIPISKAQTYGESKAEGERLAMRLMNEGLVGGCILSPTGMIGPMDYVPSEFGQVLVDLMHGRMPTLVNAGMDWVDVRDVAQAALVAEETAGNGEKYI